MPVLPSLLAELNSLNDILLQYEVTGRYTDTLCCYHWYAYACALYDLRNYKCSKLSRRSSQHVRITHARISSVYIMTRLGQPHASGQYHQRVFHFPSFSQPFRSHVGRRWRSGLNAGTSLRSTSTSSKVHSSLPLYPHLANILLRRSVCDLLHGSVCL